MVQDLKHKSFLLITLCLYYLKYTEYLEARLVKFHLAIHLAKF